MKLFRQLIPWILLAFAFFVLPAILSQFRLNLFGRYFSLSIVALGIDLIWGYTGLLSLGQGIFFALGGYAIAMHLLLVTNNDFTTGANGLPKFFENYGVDNLPFFWEPFWSFPITLIAIWVVPAVIAGLVGYLIFRNRIKGVYFSIITQATLMVFYHFQASSVLNKLGKSRIQLICDREFVVPNRLASKLKMLAESAE